MRSHLRRRLRPGPVTGGLALAALVAGVVPGTTFASEAAGSAEAQAIGVALTSSETGADNYALAPEGVPLKAKTTGDVAKVEFYADSKLLATDSKAPFEGEWKNAPEGQYSITAKAYDKDGKPVGSHPSLVNVLEKPAVIASPVARQVKQGGETTVGIKLSAKPSSDVRVTLERASGTKDISAAKSELTFTPENWDRVQQVPVNSADTTGDLAKAVFKATAAGHDAGTVPVQEISPQASEYQQDFLDLYNKINDPSSGYYRTFNGLKVPYHAIETLIVEAPDHGHETTSEAFSYYLWLESEYGRITEDWGPFNDAWASLEEFAIPGTEDQPTNGAYDASKPATYAPEHPSPTEYPAKLDSGVSVGQDPIAAELKSAYGTDEIYGMHWLLDVDNTYGFGFCGDGDTAPAFINTFQRGSQESVWETVTQPSCDTFAHGGENGFLDLFTDDASYAKQWKYTNAPDADARAVQVAYQAKKYAEEQGKAGEVADVVDNAVKMGDYLRYAMFDKYFKKIGNCTSPSCPAGSGKDSAHYLMSWYYAWGGANQDAQYPWAWRIGDGAAHQGYQNPMAAYALAEDPDMKPKSSSGQADWAKSLDRQLEFLQWLQSSEGGIAGGATNSWDGQYASPPSNASTFYGMYYDYQPVWHDPPSNRWFGFQVWGIQRTAELYAETGDERAGKIMDKWVDWALENSTIDGSGDYQIPSDLEWSGQPDTWNASNPGSNSGLHVEVLNHTNDVGVAASFAKTLLYYAAGSGDAEAREAGEGLLDGMLAHKDDLGIAIPEVRKDYNRFEVTSGEDKLYIPNGWTGTMPNGDEINSDSTFLSIRSFYESDPDFPKVQQYLNGGSAPEFTYHRYWAQTEIATAFAAHDALFG
ncbi:MULTISPECIES: glycoside hydrolase family 48 protein [Streptomyces]|nr:MULTISPECIES: glycoside hydrolase family 48 protein [Streptomyces]